MRIFFSLIISIAVMGCGNTATSTAPETTADSSGLHQYAEEKEEAAKELKDKQITFAWRQNVYNSQISDSINTIFIDTDFCKQASDEERAALGFVSAFIGSECYWDGDPDMANLKCKMNEWLNLGYQCSDKHLVFLRNWFRNDTACLNKIKDCPLIPYTASTQTTFDEIRLTVKENKIIIWFRANGMNMQTNEAWYWTEEDTFEVEDKSVKLIKTRKLNERKEKFAA